MGEKYNEYDTYNDYEDRRTWHGPGVTFKQLEAKLAACEHDLRQANVEKKHNAGKFEGAVRECRKYKKNLLGAKFLEERQSARVAALMTREAVSISQFNRETVTRNERERELRKSLDHEKVLKNRIDETLTLTLNNLSHAKQEADGLRGTDAHTASVMKKRIAELECLLIQAVIDKNADQPGADKCKRDAAMALTACSAVQSALRWICPSLVTVAVMAMYFFAG